MDKESKLYNSSYIPRSLPSRLAGEPFEQRDSEDMVETVEIPRRSGTSSGFSVRQLTGGIVSDGSAEPSTAEYVTAIQAIYTNAELVPRYGDIITLRVSGGSRLVARFWILQDDQASTNATIQFTFGTPPQSYYALNFSYAPIEQIIDAIQDYLGGANGGQEPDARDIEPEGDAPFAISVNDIYDTNPEGFLIVSASNPNISINGGTVSINDDIDATAPDKSTSQYGFTASDNLKRYVQIYLKVTVTLGGPQGTASSAIASIEHQATDSAVVPTVSATSFVGNTAIKYFTIGVVALARRGNRRFAKISQMFAGNLKEYAEGTGSNQVDSNGTNTAADLREILICVNGIPYKTHVLTGKLTQVV